ncbi:MAG: peptidase MA family metallohydrolase [Thermomicrobiales bacterium]
MMRHRFSMCVVLIIAAALLGFGWNIVGSTAAFEAQVASTYSAAENEVTPHFPETITFSLQGETPFELERVELLYSIADNPTLRLATPPFESGSTIEISHNLNLLVNFIPVGVDVTYQWRLTGTDGSVAETEPRSFTWQDDRFDWQSVTNDQVTVYSYNGNEAFSGLILETAQGTVDRLRTDFGVEEVPPIRIWAYKSTEDFRGTQMSNSESWIAGTAYPQYHVILAVLPEGDKYEVGRIVPHEISHQVLYEATRNPFNSPPIWLDEGLAVLNQDAGDEDFPALVQNAADQGRLFSVRALIATPPLDPADATLYYAESLSVVRFIVDHFGADRIAALIDAYRLGISHDEAAERALGVDLTELDRLWKASLGYQGDRGQAGGVSLGSGGRDGGASLLASGVLIMAIAAVAAVVVGVVTIRRSRRTNEEEQDEDPSGHIPGTAIEESAGSYSG